MVSTEEAGGRGLRAMAGVVPRHVTGRSESREPSHAVVEGAFTPTVA
jgi:hypothetical protein